MRNALGGGGATLDISGTRWRYSSVTFQPRCGKRLSPCLVDWSAEKGGVAIGAMGGVLFFASIGGCFMSNLLAAIRGRAAEISEVRTEVTGTIADSPTRFSTVELYVTGDSPSRDIFERLVEIADRGCIMMNTLRGKLDVRIRIGVTIRK